MGDRYLSEHRVAQTKIWLRQLAFSAYSQPGRLAIADVDLLTAQFLNPGLDAEGIHLLGQGMNFLLSSPLAAASVDALFTLLRDDALEPAVCETLVRSLRYAVSWRRPLLDPHELARLARLDHLAAHRRFLLEEILEPCLFAARVPLTPRQLSEASPFCRYALGQDVQFPWHAEAARCLRDGPKRVLMVHNIKDGQGDQILRTVPLMQALLDFNPLLRLTVIANRIYLYSHPRVATVAICEDAQAAMAFNSAYDAVVDFFEDNIRQLNENIRVERLTRDLIRKNPPFLLVCASKAYNHFVFDRVEIAGRPLAEALALHKRRIANNYETTFRLIAELGLPLRIGESQPLSPPVLAGIPWREAEHAWDELTSNNRDRRPVAILLPYGGSGRLKGHIDSRGVAAEIQRLLARGYFVVLTPCAEPWGCAEHTREVLTHLSDAEKSQVVLGNDPASFQDRDVHARMLLYHIQAADLIVAVEGWMIHAAYFLGKPYEILMLAYSESDEWRPYCATSRQEVTQTPEQPYTFARVFWLEHACEPADLPALRAAMREPDRNIRAAAARGLGHYAEGEVREDLVSLLQDPSPAVRAAAARSLLKFPSRDYDERQRCELLRAHDLIGRQPPDWPAVMALGPAVQPALEVASGSDDRVISREAEQTLASMKQFAAPPPQVADGRVRFGFSRLFRSRRSSGAKILILTPVKDAADCIQTYCEGLRRLTYPRDLISIGVLESDSIDNTFAEIERRMPALDREFRRARLWKVDFGYRLPPGSPRWADEVQLARRTVLSKSRNQLLFRALADEHWVLWLDVDVVEYPPDVLQQLLATGKDIVHPHCVKFYGGPSFDRNAWREKGQLHLDDLRREGPLVNLDAVGGTMLLVRADVHREGLIFPPFPYGRLNPRIRPDTPELETEGLGLMARDMGYQCWGMPHLEIRHRDK